MTPSNSDEAMVHFMRRSMEADRDGTYHTIVETLANQLPPSERSEYIDDDGYVNWEKVCPPR